MNISKAAAEKFWLKVDKAPGYGPDGDCWIWTGAVSPSGYPRFSMANRSWQAHHIALYLGGKERESADLHALHSCDHKLCVRPDHLRWGTTQENTQDWLERRTEGRFLSPDTVREIRASDERHIDIARRLGITSAAVLNVRKRVSHKHIP